MKSWNSLSLAGSIFIGVLFLYSCNIQNSASPSAIAINGEVSPATTQASNLSLPISEKKIKSQPSAAEIVAAVKQLVLTNSQNIKINSVKNVKLAQDVKGRWWVLASVIPVASDVDSAIIIMRKDEDKWILVDLGTGVVIERLGVPKEVLDKW